MMKKIQKIAAFGISGLLMIGWVCADELPPSNSKLLSAILKSIEAQNLGIVTNVEFDDAYWEVEIYKAGAETKLYVDAISGEIKRQDTDDVDGELPPEKGKPLSAIVESLEKQNLGTITSIEFDEGVWDVEIRDDGAETELKIDPMSGDRIR